MPYIVRLVRAGHYQVLRRRDRALLGYVTRLGASGWSIDYRHGDISKHEEGYAQRGLAVQALWRAKGGS